MRGFSTYFSLLIVWFSIGNAGFSFAQSSEHRLHSHPVFDEIDRAYQRSEITRENAILQKFRYAFDVESSIDHDEHSPIKCLFPVVTEYAKVKDQLSSAAVIEIEELTSRPRSEHTESYLSESGNFIFYYETEGQNAVPLESTIEEGVPDYVYKASFAADSSYRYQVEQAGFVDFKKSTPYEIYFQNFRPYGTTNSSGSSTFIRIHNNFEGFPSNSHPEGDVIGALYATISHEIKHAVQYETNRWKGDAGSFDWSEMDATMMEEVVFPDVNDYYNYIKTEFDGESPHDYSIFGNPGSATPGLYWHVSWMLYFYETQGIDFWVEVWEQFIDDPELPFLEAMQNSLATRGALLEREHLQNHMWHMASGPVYSNNTFGFADSENYPNSLFTANLMSVPDSLSGFLQPFSAQYIDASPSNVALGQPEFSVSANIDGVGIGVIGYFRDGSVETQFALDPNSATQTIQTTWDWADLIDISISVVNSSQNQNANYQLRVGSVLPEDDMLAQNYPNPFNPTTRIEFSLNEPKQVRVDVFDSIGRRISTLVDERLESGFHYINFDGSGLASGVYFYRIVTNEAVTSRKMVLVK